MSKRILSLLLSLLLFGAIPMTASAKSNFADDQKAIADAIESVVMLSCYDNAGNIIATGSGFCAFSSNVIITNYHVISDGVSSITARTEGDLLFEVQYLVAADAVNDIAILKTKAKIGLNTLPIGSLDSLGKGSRVIAIGSPLGIGNTVSEGLYNGKFDDGKTESILFNAAISHGSSGGALFDNAGNVIGITAGAFVGGNDLYYAVPIEKAVELWKKSSDQQQPLNDVLSSNNIDTTIVSATVEAQPNDVQKLYEEAEAEYEKKNYKKARALFAQLPEGYLKRDEYLMLSRAHSLRWDMSGYTIDDLKSIIGFKDTKSVLVSSHDIACDFLEGTWKTTDNKYEITVTRIEDNKLGYGKRYSFETTLPKITVNGYAYSIENGIYSLSGNGQSIEVFKFTVNGKDGIRVYCYKDGNSYLLTRW